MILRPSKLVAIAERKAIAVQAMVMAFLAICDNTPKPSLAKLWTGRLPNVRHSFVVGSYYASVGTRALIPQIMLFAFSLNRLLFLGLSWVGFAALLLGVKKSWFYVPIGPENGAASAKEIVQMSPGITPYFQAIVAMGAICIFASWLHRRQWTLLSTMLASFLFFATLSYPYFVMVRSPIVSAEAAWLQSQHDNLLWLGGDIHNNAEFAQSGWKSKVYLIDPSRQLAVIPLPSWSPWEIGLDRCYDLLLWLGYSNAFCQFTRAGWSMSAVGSCILFLVSLQKDGSLVFARAGAALALLTGLSVVAAIVGWSLPFQASRHIRIASEHMSQCRYQESLVELEKAVALLPVLAQDTYYVAQRGVLDDRMGIESDYSKLKKATTLEGQARYDQAYSMIEPLIHSEIASVKREALRAVMRFAIQDYNCARFELARNRMYTVLRAQPCNVKLIYLNQLIGIREGRPDYVDEMRDWMYLATDHFQFNTKKILRAAAQQHCAITAGMTNDEKKIWAALQKAKSP
jgi:hypothetical protein